MKKNEIPEEFFQIFYEGKVPLKGVITTSDLRIRLRKKEISNESKEVRFFYDLDGYEQYDGTAHFDEINHFEMAAAKAAIFRLYAN